MILGEIEIAVGADRHTTSIKTDILGLRYIRDVRFRNRDRNSPSLGVYRKNAIAAFVSNVERIDVHG